MNNAVIFVDIISNGGRNYYSETLAEECKYKVKEENLKRQKNELVL